MKPKTDEINPSHYQRGGVQAIDVIEAWGLGFCLGTLVKYVQRCGHKAENSRLQDLKKARWYLDREIANEEKAHGQD